MTNNVISFPGSKKINNNETTEQIAKNIKTAKAEEIEILTLDISDLILSELQHQGIDLDKISTEQLKDFGLLMETVKSMISRYYNEPHFLHKLTDNMFEADGEDLYFSNSNTIIIAKGDITDGPPRP